MFFLYTMHFLITLTSIDPSNHLGRLDYSSLSEQALMEIVVDGITQREVITRSKENPKDFSEWYGVKLNDNGDVVRLTWQSLNLAGTISLEWLPSTIGDANISHNDLSGTIDWTKLPPYLTRFVLNENKFFGEVNLSHLPKDLRDLFLSDNTFTGGLNFEKLPKFLKEFFAARNRFTGTIDLTQLPSGLTGLSVSDNQLSGSINLTSLPECLERLYLNGNSFCGTIDLGRLSHSLRTFHIHDTVNIEGSIELDCTEVFTNLSYFKVSNTNLHGNILIDEEDSENFLVENSNVKLTIKS